MADQEFDPEQRVLLISYDCRTCFEEHTRRDHRDPAKYPNGTFLWSLEMNLTDVRSLLNSGQRTVVCENGHQGAKITDKIENLRNRLQQASTDPRSRFRIY